MKTAIVTGGTKKDVDAMAVLALNIQNVSPELADELIIFHDGISKKKQRLIQKIMPTRFIRYKCPINWFSLMSNKTVRYFSPMVFCKYECLRLLEEFDTVIWTDYDVLIRDDISELKDSKNNINVILEKRIPLKEMFYKTIEKIDMTDYNLQGECITAPLMVLKRAESGYKKYYEYCYAMTKKYIQHLYLPEQCIFTMLFQKYQIQYAELDKEVYCYHPNEATEKTKILHAYGQPKFWNGLYNEQWEEYRKKWEKIVKYQ